MKTFNIAPYVSFIFSLSEECFMKRKERYRTAWAAPRRTGAKNKI
jgi:hypothetical protein